MKKFVKSIKAKIQMSNSIKRSYLSDCKEYTKWNYNNPNVKTKNALEAKILRQTHVLEKGMSLESPRHGFGVQKAMELLSFIDEFVAYGYQIEDSTPVCNAIGVLEAYVEFHKDRKFEIPNVSERLEQLKKYIPRTDDVFGIKSQDFDCLERAIHGEFPEFIKSRHSVRQFSERSLNYEDVGNAVRLAMNAPSACNRQSCKVYYYQDKKINNELAELIAGNTGFEQDARAYLVLTSDMSAFYDAFERNQVYVDAGIFCMALIEALHYYGIASCVLQNGELPERNLKFKKNCGNIPENEKIVLFIAIGYYKDKVIYATSHRKKLEEVFIVK